MILKLSGRSCLAFSSRVRGMALMTSTIISTSSIGSFGYDLQPVAVRSSRACPGVAEPRDWCLGKTSSDSVPNSGQRDDMVFPSCADAKRLYPPSRSTTLAACALRVLPLVSSTELANMELLTQSTRLLHFAKSSSSLILVRFAWLISDLEETQQFD